MGQQENEPLINQPQAILTPQPQQPQYYVPQQPQSQQYYYQPQYAQAEYQQQYAQPYAQPVYAATTTVITGDSHCHKKDEHHITGAVIVLILGLFFTPLWLLGLMYIRSHNKSARALGITSVCLFAVCLVIFIILISTIH